MDKRIIIKRNRLINKNKENSALTRMPIKHFHKMMLEKKRSSSVLLPIIMAKAIVIHLRSHSNFRTHITKHQEHIKIL